MDRKYDFDTDEICYEKVSDESKITPIEITCGVCGRYSDVTGHIQRVGSETLESC